MGYKLVIEPCQMAKNSFVKFPAQKRAQKKSTKMLKEIVECWCICKWLAVSAVCVYLLQKLMKNTVYIRYFSPTPAKNYTLCALGWIIGKAKIEMVQSTGK